MSTRNWGEVEEDRFEEGWTMTASQLVDAYCAFLQAERKVGEKHLTNVRWTLVKILVQAETDGIRPQSFGKRALKARFAQRQAAGISDQTCKAEAVTCKALYAWLYKERYFEKNLLEGFETPSVGKKSEEEQRQAATKALLDGWLKSNNAYYADSKIHGWAKINNQLNLRILEGYRLRDQFYTLLLADSAVRPVEASRIKLNNIKLDSDGDTYIELSDASTKSGIARKLPLSKVTVTALNAWLNFRKGIKWESGIDQGFLICAAGEDTSGNQNLDSGSWSQQFRKKVLYGQAKGFIPESARLVPYSFKDYCLQLMEVVDVTASCELAGHSTGKMNLTTHNRYTKSDNVTAAQTQRNQQYQRIKVAHMIAAPVDGLKHVQV